MLEEGSQTEGGFKEELVQRNPNVVVLMHMFKIKEAQRSGVEFIPDYLGSCKLHKITGRSKTVCPTTASSQTAAPLKFMTRSESHSRKEKAISKSNFYYAATCLTLGNLLLFAGAASSDLQAARAHE